MEAYRATAGACSITCMVSVDLRGFPFSRRFKTNIYVCYEVLADAQKLGILRMVSGGEIISGGFF